MVGINGVGWDRMLTVFPQMEVSDALEARGGLSGGQGGGALLLQFGISRRC